MDASEPADWLEQAMTTRRRFMKASAAVAMLPLSSASGAADDGPVFHSQWSLGHDRVWLGPEFWANPLQDWRLAKGRVECVNPAMDRNVHLLTRCLSEKPGLFNTRVRIGRLEGRLSAGAGSAGFRVGIQGPLKDYRNSLFFGTGLDAGFTIRGGLFIGSLAEAKPVQIALDLDGLELRLSAEPKGESYQITLSAHDLAGKLLGLTEKAVPASALVGNVALVANFGKSVAKAKGKEKNPAAGFGAGTFWFDDWSVSGTKVESHEERAFGPILFNHYTLSGQVLTLTAQMPPLGEKDSQLVRLEVRRGQRWQPLAEAKIHPQARTATFRVEKWNDRVDHEYRLAYDLTMPDGREVPHYYAGIIRKDPVDKPIITVADISCNFHSAFPNAAYVQHLKALDPDLLAFVGDQFYESTGGYGVQREPLDAAILDYLRKWYAHGWTWRELTKDRPAISLPDDHDVYQGNIWGEGGSPQTRSQEAGGYQMPAAWVNVVHRTQTSHHPAPYDPSPARQGISNYYGPLTYGRISFAILADRMYKTGPEGKVPPTGGRGDHVTDPHFDPKTADIPGAQLLGPGQMRFLREWAADWRGADMKAVISQTIFSAMATTHGGTRDVLRADYDTNAWPQTARNAALREIRKAFAVHIAGDQHLPAVIQYGIESHRDASVAFAGPAVNVGYPRWWEPKTPGQNRKPGDSEWLGDFIDHFGHPMTVLAVKNGEVKPRSTVLEMMQDKASGLGVVRFNKDNRTITFECWPYLADPTKDPQFPGWPVTIRQLDNYGPAPAAHLPKLEFSGVEDPIVQVINEADGEVIYTLRINGAVFQPMVFAKGLYTVRVSTDDGKSTTLTHLEAKKDNPGVQLVNL